MMLAATLALALALAGHVWGPTVCGNEQPAIVRADLPGDEVGRATYSTLDGRPVDCTITLDPWAERARWRTCTLVLHEWGHLAGAEHSANPRSVMYPVVLGPDPRCRR